MTHDRVVGAHSRSPLQHSAPLAPSAASPASARAVHFAEITPAGEAEHAVAASPGGLQVNRTSNPALNPRDMDTEGAEAVRPGARAGKTRSEIEGRAGADSVTVFAAARISMSAS